MATSIVLLTYDLFEDGDASRQIIAIHHEWRKQAERVIPRCQCEKPFVPSPLDDLVGRLDDIEPPDEPGPADCPHLSGTAGNSIELFPEPRPIFTDGAEE